MIKFLGTKFQKNNYTFVELVINNKFNLNLI